MPPGNGGDGGDSAGGAIEALGPCSLTNCNLSGNSAVAGPGGAGGISGYFLDDDGIVYDCGRGSSGNDGQALGGGIHAPGSLGPVLNTIIAGNSAYMWNYNYPSGSPDVSGAVSSAGHNLVGAANGSTGWLTSDLKGSTEAPLNPRLENLKSNGGPTPTMALQAGSPAADAGDDTVLASVPFDQRGQARPVAAHVDIGAYEGQLPAPTLSIGRSGVNVTISWPSPSTGFVLQQNANLANPSGWSSYGSTINDDGTTKSVTITPPTGSLFFRLKGN